MATRVCASGVLLIRPCKHSGGEGGGRGERVGGLSRLTKLQFKLPLRLFSRSLSASIERSAISPNARACVRQFAERKVLNKSSQSASKVHLMYFGVLLYRDMIETEMPNKLFAFAKAQINYLKKKKKNAEVDTVQIHCFKKRCCPFDDALTTRRSVSWQKCFVQIVATHLFER